MGMFYWTYPSSSGVPQIVVSNDAHHIQIL